jgi:hypothetical protein
MSLKRFDEALTNLAVVKRLTNDPQLLKDVHNLASRCFTQLKKDTLAKQVLSSN